MREYKKDRAWVFLPMKINNCLRSTFRIKTHIWLQRDIILLMYRHSKTGLQSGHELDAHLVSPLWHDFSPTFAYFIICMEESKYILFRKNVIKNRLLKNQQQVYLLLDVFLKCQLLYYMQNLQSSLSQVENPLIKPALWLNNHSKDACFVNILKLTIKGPTQAFKKYNWKYETDLCLSIAIFDDNISF